MGRYLSKELGERSIMEKAAEIEAAQPPPAAGKKRKVYVGESELSTSSIQLKNRRLAENSASPASSGNSSCETVGIENNALASSCCSSNGWSELTKGNWKFLDLELDQDNDEVTVEFFATSAAGDSLESGERRGTTTLREDEAESGELESTARPRQSNPRRRSTVEEMQMPSEAELDEFFAAAENNLAKKFIDKYNYDIVKDEPMKGRYEWVQIQIKP